MAGKVPPPAVSTKNNGGRSHITLILPYHLIGVRSADMGSKKYSGWSQAPRLDEARVMAPEVPPQARARKDRRHWCKGKVGVEHKTAAQQSKNSRFMLTKYGPDSPHTRCQWESSHGWRLFRDGRRWVTTGRNFWSCRHELACVNCGKILKHYGVGKDCPDRTPEPKNFVCACWSCEHRYADRV